MEIELAGAREVRRTVPGAVSVFIMPPSLEELAARLERRATDTEGEIAQRLATSRVELEAMHEFDHRVVNEDVGQATEAFADVVAKIVGAVARG